MIGGFMNVKEAAAFLEYTERHVAWLCGEGKLIGAQKDGLMWFIPEETVKIYKLTHSKGRKSKSQSSIVGTISSEEVVSCRA